MEFLALYNNRLLGLLLISLVILIQHAQIISYLKDAHDIHEDTWNSDASDAFDFLKKLALRFEDDAYIIFFILAASLTVLSFTIYFVISSKLHAWNRVTNNPIKGGI